MSSVAVMLSLVCCQDVSVYFRPPLEVKDVLLLTHRALQEFPSRVLPRFKPWFPSASDPHKPIKPLKPAPLISSEDLQSVSLRLEDASDRTKPAKRSKPWFPSASDAHKPIKPLKPAPLISSEDLQSVSLRLEDASDRTKPIESEAERSKPWFPSASDPLKPLKPLKPAPLISSEDLQSVSLRLEDASDRTKPIESEAERSKPWFPSASDALKPLKPLKPAPLISSEDLQSVSLRLEDPDRTKPVESEAERSKPWFPSASDAHKPIKPLKHAPLISSEDLQSVSLRLEDPDRTKPVERSKPWFPSASDAHKPLKPAPLISSEDLQSVSLRLEDPDRTKPVERSKPWFPSASNAHKPLKPAPLISSEDLQSVSLRLEDPDRTKPVERSKRSWCVITDRSAPLEITRSFSRLFLKTVEKHGLHLRQRVKWVVCERNCGARSMEELWLDLNRAIRRSRMPTCNANYQRALPQIWLYCDVFYCEYIGNVLKQEFQLSGQITLTAHKLGDIVQL